VAEVKECRSCRGKPVRRGRRGDESTPAVITRRGKKQAVVVSYQEWQRLSHVPSFGRLLIAAPLAADDLPKRNNMRGDD
jgi:antitoxin Phd